MSQQKFIDRTKELDFLDRAYTSRKPEFIILYGRRRIGKTELILRFLEKKPGLYFLASTEGDRENIANFKKIVAELIKDSTFAELEFKDWFSLFDAIFKNVNFLKLIKKRRFVLAIDEFPFLIHSNPAIPSIFQRIWEQILRKKPIMLILCGSSVAIIEEEVIGYKSPLYGRRTGQWELQPLSFTCMNAFFPRYSIEELANTWFVVGGIPAYALKLNPKMAFWQNIGENMLKKGTYLYREVEVVLKEEFREPKNYTLILKTIALGKTTLSEICTETGFGQINGVQVSRGAKECSNYKGVNSCHCFSKV